MKRFVALALACMCLLSASCAFAVPEYTVAEKLLKQLWAGSGFSGVLTVEAAAQPGKPGTETHKPLVVDVDYIYVRPTEEETDEHRMDLILMDGEIEKSAASLQLKDGLLSLQADLLGEGWYALDAGKPQQGAALAAAVQQAAGDSGVPALAQAASALFAALGVSGGAEEWIAPYTTRMDIWIEGYRQDAVLGKTEDGTGTMQADYLIPPAAIRAQVKQLVYELLGDHDALTALTDAVGEEAAALYLNPALMDWYFEAIDALPLTGSLTISRKVSFKGETLDLHISLPLYDAQTGETTLTYARTQGEGDLPDDHVIALENSAGTLRITYQEYSSMTGVKVMQGQLENTSADEAAGWAVGFTLKLEETETKDLENRDVYAFNVTLALSPVEGRQSIAAETGFEFTSRFVSKETKSAATEMQACLTLSGENTVVQCTFEGASRKKWEPAPITAPRVNLSDLTAEDTASLLANAGLQALALLAEYAAMPE